MQDKMYYLSLAILMGCSVAITWKYFQVADEGMDFPSKEEILSAIEKGASNLTVTPVTSDN